LPFVTLFGIFIVVAAAFGFCWCLEAAVAGVSTSRGTCSGFSANFHVTFNIHFYIKIQFFVFVCVNIAKLFLRAREEKRNKKNGKIKLKGKSIFMLFRLNRKQRIFDGEKREIKVSSSHHSNIQKLQANERKLSFVRLSPCSCLLIKAVSPFP
jgi:hypothetical protein